MKEIQLTKGHVALVDDEDYEWLKEFKWQSKDKKTVIYACRREPIPDGKQTTLLMHRLIMNAQKGEIIDHINGNGLDNRKSNLRFANQSQNCMNRKTSNGASKYKGVYWSKRENKWCVQIKLNDKRKTIGYFINEDEAGMAYNLAATKFYGEFANINEI